jgi:hypothetical protein
MNKKNRVVVKCDKTMTSALKIPSFIILGPFVVHKSFFEVLLDFVTYQRIFSPSR